MNILIKLTCLVGLAIAPILGQNAAKAKPIQMGNGSIEIQKQQPKTDAQTLSISPSK